MHQNCQQNNRLEDSAGVVRFTHHLGVARETTDVAIIGAGPYGLSIAAHLLARGIVCRVIGKPMHTWTTQMPSGMRLKSEGFASSLYDPDSALTLSRYCGEKGLPYADIGLPVDLHTFTEYGIAFQRRFVPDLEDALVTSLERTSSGFLLRTDGPREISARKVIVAAGISHFQYLPPVLARLGPHFVSHTSARTSYEQFANREVAVIGAGASALDVAASLIAAGARVQVIARKPTIHFHNPPGRIPRPFFERLRAPMTGLGPGWKSWLCTECPLVFYRMPKDFRMKVVRKHLGPAPGWFIRQQVDGKVPYHLHSAISAAHIEADRAHLSLSSPTGSKVLSFDHVIAGTGYRVDLRRLTFLHSELTAQISSLDRTPVLSTNFESSVPGLYFVGASSANNFGPMVRFAYGAKFTAQRLSRHLGAISR